MEENKCLSPKLKARGVIPEKVSDLDNDLKFITAKELENIIFANQVGAYTGEVGEEIEVIVDNLYKTIGVRVLKSIEDQLTKLLPKSNGLIKEGNYVLKATVSGQQPIFVFSEESSLLSTNYYYGNVSVGAENITEDVIKTLSNGGPVKEDKEYTYSTYKQYQVFAYPVKFGALSSIEHVQTGFNVLELFNLVEVKVGELDYYVYVSETPSTGEYTYRFKY